MIFRMQNQPYLIVTPTAENAKELCSLITKSIIEVCGPDYQNNVKILQEWTKNKTPENVAKWINMKSNLSFSVLDKTNSVLVGFILVNNKGEILLNYLFCLGT